MTTFDYYYNDIWQKTLDKIRESNQVPETVMTYFKSELVSLSDQEAKIKAPAFVNLSIMSQNSELIASCLEEVIGRRVKITISQEVEPPKNNYDFNSLLSSHQIDSNQTFTNFVVGRSNSQAHIACLTCATNLGMVYNPLFIYGNSGLGKTHLLNAVGNQVRTLYPDKKIALISGLEFVEGVAKASKENKLDQFKESFYDLDLLLVDDIQFIAGKDKTHEIFFTVFNNLTNNKKQICVTADRTPSEIKGLEDRIISRFNQGLTVNIETPEYETSINILKMEFQNNSFSSNYDVDDEVLSYLATNFSHDVRSLKGAVTRLLFYSINFPTDPNSNRITLPLVFEAFKDQIPDNRNELSISIIKKTVCDYYGLTKQQIISANRTKNIATARHIAMYLCRKLVDASYKEIGYEFGKRDHSTVITSCEKVEKLVKTDPLYAKAVSELEKNIKR